ncbi:hypothetical protein [Aquibium microcysteis]|uniref:hypothetical protein n=1 Tax=Aquibium microcysteis TaxID=675281 RepID=UPI00165D273B|nr:hypothetical protein [Aquibium microcysteis]
MFDVRYLRPISGEIMTDDRIRSSRPSLADGIDEIEDAEFEVLHLSEVIPSRTDHFVEREWAESTRRPEGMDILKSRIGGAPLPRERAGPLFWVFGVVLAAASFWISGGHSLSGTLLAFLPAPAEKPMRIANLTSGVEERNGRRLVVVDGSVENTASSAGIAPTLAIEVMSDAGRVTRYTLGSAGALVEPGEHYRFSSRVNAPMGVVAGVSVKMAERND